MKFNASKTKAMMVSRPRTINASAADKHFKQLESVVSGVSLLTGNMLEFNIAIVDLWQYNIIYAVYDQV